MIVERFEQGSAEWKAARVGIHTASQWDALVTPLGKIKTGAGPETYLNTLISECLIGEREEIPPNLYWLKRGMEIEPEARDTLEAVTGVKFEEVGIIYRDESKTSAASPDGINFDIRIGCEIKCPAPKTHIEYLRAGVLPKDYTHQVQGAMLVTGFDHWYFMSYHPELKPLIVKVERDEKYIKALDEALTKSIEMKLNEVERLAA